jgi:hypothetical protein
MKWSRLFMFACVVALGMSTAVAQEPTSVLQIEIERGGSIVAKPQLRLLSGREGRLELSDEFAPNVIPLLKGLREKITITPTVRGDDIALAFNIASSDKQFRPALVISKDVRGSVEWTAADGQPIRLSISWVQ